MVRAAVLQFREMGLEPVIYRHAAHVINKRGASRVGYMGGNATLSMIMTTDRTALCSLTATL